MRSELLSMSARQNLGIDRRTVKRWDDRGRQPWGYVRWRGVHRRSTAPKRPSGCCGERRPSGYGGGGEATGFCREKLGSWPRLRGWRSPPTIHRYLQRVGLVRPSTKRRRPRFQNGQSCDPVTVRAWAHLQMDVKPPRSCLGCRTPATSTRPMDISSRYKVGLILPCWMRAERPLGSVLEGPPSRLPRCTMSVAPDNGLEFQSRLSHQVHARPHTSTSGKSATQCQNAVIERATPHGEEECFFWLEEAECLVSGFLDAYNTTRPHMGINMLTPKEAIALYQKS